MALSTTMKTDLYRFFAVAFDAAPGVTYMSQLADAANAGMSIQQIVEVFTTKPQFTSVYPNFFTNAQFADKLIETVVGDSATAEAKTEAKASVEAALNLGGEWTRGKVIYQVFNNLANKAADDAVWGGTSKMMANQIAYAQYYTEVAMGDTTDMAALRAVIANVTASSSTTTADMDAALSQGQTFMLTAGVDEFAGKAGHDTFKVWDGVTDGGSNESNAVTVVGADDVIDGGAGTDTLNWTATIDHNNEQVGSFSNIELVNITGADNIGGYNEELVAAYADVDAAQAVVDAADDGVVAAYGVVYQAAYDVDAAEDVLYEYGRYFDVYDDESVAGLLWYLQAYAGDIYDSLADNEAYDAAVVAGTAGYVTWEGIRAAIVGVINRYEDAYDTAYEALYDADDVRDDAVVVLTDALNARDYLEDLDNDGEIDASFFGGMTTLTHDGEYVDTIELAGNQTLVLTGEDVNGDLFMKTGATVANIVFDGTVIAEDFDVYQAGYEGNALDTINVTSSTIEFLSLWTYNAAEVNIDIDTAGRVDLHLDSVDADVAAVIDASASTADLYLHTNQEDIASITTGTGDDTVVWDAEGVPNDLTIVTGAGSDTVEFNHTATQLGTITVDLGTDDDMFDSSSMDITDFAPEITDVDGGDGIDTLQVSLESGIQTLETYIRLTDEFKNFEILDIVNHDDSTIDASELTGYKTFIFNEYSTEATIINVSEDQLIIRNGSYGDDLSDDGFVSGAYTNITAVDYAGAGDKGDTTISLTFQNGDGQDGFSAADVSADSLSLTINAQGNNGYGGLDGDYNPVVVEGDLNSLTANIKTWVEGSDEQLDSGYSNYANAALHVDTSDTLADLESIVVTSEGDYGMVTLFNAAGSSLASVDLSGFTTMADDADVMTEDTADFGVFYGTENADVVETITLNGVADGSNLIIISNGSYGGDWAWGSNFDNMDTITGFDFDNDTLVVLDGTFEGIDGGSFDDEQPDYWWDSEYGFTVVASADLAGSTLSTVLQNLATDTVDDSFVFTFEGNTYVYADETENSISNTLSNNDFLVKIVGVADLTEQTGWFSVTA